MAKNNEIIEKYKKRIVLEINKIMRKTRKKYIYEPTLLGNSSPEYVEQLKTSFYIRQLHMIEGIIGQRMLGLFEGWEDLDLTKNVRGFDIMKSDGSCIAEIKNKWNTCNSSSLKATLDKLVEYKKNNPNVECIYGIINPKKDERDMKSIIVHNGHKIIKLQGDELLNKVFFHEGYNYKNDILKIVKNAMYNNNKFFN